MPTELDVAIVGGGLAGLVAARRLHRAGLTVAVYEAADDIGGRLRTDILDGFTLDRGFQTVCPAYPALHAEFDLADLDLRPFARGVTVMSQGRRHRISPSLPTTLEVTRLIGWRGAAALAAMSLRDSVGDAAGLKRRPDRSMRDDLTAAGVTHRVVDRLLNPFLSGVFLEPDLATSARFGHLVWRSFLRAGAALPATGIAALPQRIAWDLPSGTIRCGTPVHELTPGGLRLADATNVTARAVVVATDADTAARLLPGLRTPSWNAVTTLYHTADALEAEPMLTIDADRPDLIRNTVALSAVVPEYSASGRPLIATSILGASTVDSALETAIRDRLARLYSTSAKTWELIRSYPIPHALPAMPAPHPLTRRVRHGTGRYVCGDHRDTSSIQGALVSGRRAADAVLTDLGRITNPETELGHE